MDVIPFINIVGTCPPCPIGIDAPVAQAYYCNCIYSSVVVTSSQIIVKPKLQFATADRLCC